MKKVIVRKNIVLLLIIMVLAIVILVFQNIYACKASEYSYTCTVSSPLKEKCYKFVTVNKGDTLWSIANNYITSDYSSVDIYIQEIKKLNNIENDTVILGSTLIISYYSDILY